MNKDLYNIIEDRKKSGLVDFTTLSWSGNEPYRSFLPEPAQTEACNQPGFHFGFLLLFVTCDGVL